jgi:hypothetical protein
MMVIISLQMSYLNANVHYVCVLLNRAGVGVEMPTFSQDQFEKVPKTAQEIYALLQGYGVPPEKTLECANKLIKPYSALLDYAIKIGYKVD